MNKKLDFLNLVVSLLPIHFDNEVAHFIACQFALESDFGQSAMSLCQNNFCGMKVPSLRATLCLNPDEKGKFAKYSGITSCVHDYVVWLVAMKFTRQDYNNIQVFSNHLKLSGYCPDPDYIDRINSIYNQYYSPKNK